MGQVLDSLRGKSFKSAKCKNLLNGAISRSKRLRGQREIQCKALRNDIAKLLQSGEEVRALSKVDDVFREQNKIDAYALIENFCRDVTNKMVLIEREKACPSELKEAIVSLCFAAQRCTELPELQQIRSVFTAKYGRHFTTALPEVHPNCGVSKEITEKLTTSKASGNMQLKLMKEIANENGIEWKFEKLQDGPDHFIQTKKIDMSSRPLARVSTALENSKNISDLEKTASHTQSQPAGIQAAADARSFTPLSSILSTENVKKPIARSVRSGKLDSSEQGQIPLVWIDGKTNGNEGHKGWNSNDDYQTLNHCFGSARFSAAQGFYLGYKEEKIMYDDVATAAQAALKSAEDAAIAARAALSFAESEYNQNSSQTTEDSSEITSESSDYDEMDEAFEKGFLRDRNEQRHKTHSQVFPRDIGNRISVTSGYSQCSQQQRDNDDNSDVEYESVNYPISFRKKAQVKRGRSEACVNKPISWVKSNSDKQLSPRMLPCSKVKHHQNCLYDDGSDRYASRLDRRQWHNQGRATYRSVSEMRLRPRMSLEDEHRTQRSQSSRLENIMISNDFRRSKFRSKTPIPWKSTSMDFYGNDDFSGGVRNKLIVSQNSDKEGLYRGRGTGKVKRYSANLQDQLGQRVSSDERKSKNGYSLSKLDPGKNNGKFRDGFNHGKRSLLSNDLVVVNQSIHDNQEKGPSSESVKDSLQTTHSGLETKEEECPRINLARLPKSLRSGRMHSFKTAE